MILLTSNKVQPKVSDHPFVEREEEMKITEEIARFNYSSFLDTKEKDTEKQKHIFTIINGGSGSGKTRACHEFAQKLLSKYNYDLH
jgi:Cdc6-like AAA superfamily ATPase